MKTRFSKFSRGAHQKASDFLMSDAKANLDPFFRDGALIAEVPKSRS